MIYWNYMVAGMSLVLLAFLFWKELARKDRRRLMGRLLASIVAVTSLACLAIPVSIKKIKQASDQEAILVTEGYNRDSVENFVRKNKENIRIYDEDSIAWIDNEITALHIFGYGLCGADLKILNSIPLVFHPSPVNNGIITANWQKILKRGEKLAVQGTFVNNRLAPVKISLNGFDTPLDSIMVPAQKTAIFDLSTFPKNVGRAVYFIVVSGKDGILEKEPVPVEVKPVDTLKIMLLAASPDFENKFLRNRLSEDGYAIASRTRISKNKYDKTFNNTPSLPFDRITNSLLEEFDIIISDATELSALSKTELSFIHAQIQDNGLGLIVKADSIETPGAFYASPFAQLPAVDKQKLFTALYINDAGKITLPLPSDSHSYIRSKPGGQPLVFDSLNNVLVSSVIDGNGIIIFTTINNTYSWALTGDDKDYYLFWSALLQKAVKKSGAGQNLLVTNWPKAGDPVGITLESPDVPLSQFNIDINNNRVPLQQSPDLSFQWQGTYWPEHKGWQPAINLFGKQDEWYVYDTADWKNMSALEKMNKTYQYISNKNNMTNKSIKVQKYVSMQLPTLFFLLIFIICCCFLWIEKKFSI